MSQGEEIEKIPPNRDKGSISSFLLPCSESVSPCCSDSSPCPGMMTSFSTHGPGSSSSLSIFPQTQEQKEGQSLLEKAKFTRNRCGFPFVPAIVSQSNSCRVTVFHRILLMDLIFLSHYPHPPVHTEPFQHIAAPSALLQPGISPTPLTLHCDINKKVAVLCPGLVEKIPSAGLHCSVLQSDQGQRQMGLHQYWKGTPVLIKNSPYIHKIGSGMLSLSTFLLWRKKNPQKQNNKQQTKKI